MRYEVERDLVDVEFHILSGLSSEASDCDESGLEKGKTQPCSNVSHDMRIRLTVLQRYHLC